MVLGYQKGIENHIELLNKNNLQIYKNKTDSDYRLGLQKLKQSFKKEKITQQYFDSQEKILKENYQKRQSEEQEKINIISYNHQNKTITGKKSVTIPDTVYILYKQIYKHVTKKWKYPSCKNISMRIDSRCMSIENPENAFQSGKLLYWLKLNLIESITQINGKKKFAIAIPLLKNEYFLSKKGILAQSIFIGKDKTGQLFIRIMKNMTESIQNRKTQYQNMIQRKYNLNNSNSNKRLLALDFGLRVMFTDQEGNQYGRNWFSIIRQYDSLIQKRMKLLQEKEQNPKLSQDTTYVTLVSKCRNYIKNEINRVLTHIIETRNPDKLILENIKFINPDLSKSMNRLIQNCGRKVIGNKIKSLQEEYGLEVEYVNPAYTSQLCSCCGFLHKENRKGERYDCVGCGNKLNADVNAGRNILMRYLMNNTVKVSLTPMEPCSIGLTMSKKSVRNAVTGISFLKMFRWIKNYYRLSIIAQEPMMGNCLNAG
jgi:putative transposase